MKRFLAVICLVFSLSAFSADTWFDLIRIGPLSGKGGTSTFTLNSNTYTVNWVDGKGRVLILDADLTAWSSMRAAGSRPYESEFITQTEDMADIAFADTEPSFLVVPYDSDLWASPPVGDPGSDFYDLAEAVAEQGTQADIVDAVDTGEILSTVREVAGVNRLYYRKYDVERLPIAAPTSTCTVALANLGAGNVTSGEHYYKVTFYTDAGETDPSGASGAVTTIDTRNGKVNLSSIPTGDSGTVGRYLYRTEAGGATYYRLADIADNVTTTYVDNIADGSLGAEEPPGANGSGVADPDSAPSYALANEGAGNVTAGAHSYKVTFYTAIGETDVSAASGGVTTHATDNGKVELTNIPTGGTGTVGRKIYRNEAGGGTWKLLTTIEDNVTTSYTDNTADGSLGAAAPSSNDTAIADPVNIATAALAGTAGNVTAGTHSWKYTWVTAVGESTGPAKSNVVSVADQNVDGQVNLAGIALGPTGTTSRKVYRTVAGDGGNYKLVGTIANNTETTYTDNVADGSLGADMPGANATELTDPAATCDDDLWNNGAGNLDNDDYNYKYTFVSAIGETDVSDAAGAAVTVADNTVNGQVLVSGIVAGPTGTTARKVYRTEGGGAAYKLLTTIADNETTTFLDNVADGSLGAAAPSSNDTTVNTPGSAPTAALWANGAGNVNDGTHVYKIVYYSRDGETDASDASDAVEVLDATVNGQVSLTSIPVSPASRCTDRYIYRSKAGTTTPLYYLGAVGDNTTTTYSDNVADASLGAELSE